MPNNAEPNTMPVLRKRHRRRAQVVTVSGGKGGVGKTFFTVNFGVELSNRGYRVLIFDADVNLSNVNLLLHIDSGGNLRDFFAGKFSMADVIQKGVGGVDVLYTGNDLDSLFEMDETQFNRILEGFNGIETRYDYILIDTQAGLNDINLKFIRQSDRTIMITNPEITALVDLYRVIKLYSKKKRGINFEIVVNRVSRPEYAAIVYEKLTKTVSNFKIGSHTTFLGYILEDQKRVIESIQKQVPIVILHEQGSLSECFKIIARAFLRNVKPKRKVSFFQSLLGKRE